MRLRPLRDYYDVWTLIEEPETFAIQRQTLIERPHDGANRRADARDAQQRYAQPTPVQSRQPQRLLLLLAPVASPADT